MQSITPLGDRILVRPEDPEETTKSGIVIPQSARRQDSNLVRGRVLAAGPGDRGPDDERLPMETKVGDEVLYFRSPQAEVEIDGVRCQIVHEEQYAVAVIER